MADSDRYNASIPCPFSNTSSACNYYYPCDPGSKIPPLLCHFHHLMKISMIFIILLLLIGNGYNNNQCKKIVRAYCCGDGLLNLDPYCLALQNSSSLGCNSACTDFYSGTCDSKIFGLWNGTLQNGGSYILGLNATAGFLVGQGQTFPLAAPRCNATLNRFDVFVTGQSAGAFLRFSYQFIDKTDIVFSIASPGVCSLSSNSSGLFSSGWFSPSVLSFFLHSQ